MSEAEREERLEDIEYWWSGGFQGAFAAESRAEFLEAKLYEVVKRVLLAMPEEDFEVFLLLRPQIVCQPLAVHGAIWRYVIPVMPGMKEAIVRVVYFTPAFGKWSADRLTRLVAHEFAHLVLGHDSPHVTGHGDIHAEEATDRKSESWGFRAAYSRKERQELADHHRQDKAGRSRTRTRGPRRA